ncbi:hypothetical protein BXZ70DRAFT_921950 [Cristinia sonorae]|uniref:F-box domain-containing protein n=1 Tax=Cristinia sonorae TaxID=1940300 RepID=A0A8K0XT16_9AGAR|nr:hypothetical protein BXZ70DRAFT_921950 [Cristinia sonorae]
MPIFSLITSKLPLPAVFGSKGVDHARGCAQTQVDLQSTTTKSSLPQLPIEVWEAVIEAFWTEEFRRYGAIVQSTQQQLAACSLVCRSWTPRSLYFLYKWLKLGSESQLQGAVRRLIITPNLAARIETMDIQCKSGTDQAWVTLVPLRLPKLDNLQKLYFFGLNLNRRYPIFYEAYRQLHVPELWFWYTTYSRYSHILQLARATHCTRLVVTETHVHRPRAFLPLGRNRDLGRLHIGGPSLRQIHIDSTWADFCIASQHWTFLSPALAALTFVIVDGGKDTEPTLFGEDSIVWQRTINLFLDLTIHNTNLQDRMEVTIWRSMRNQDKRDIRDILVVSMTLNHGRASVSFGKEIMATQVIIFLLSGIATSRGQFHEIDFPDLCDHEPDHATRPVWTLIDDALVHPSFAEVEVCNVVSDSTVAKSPPSLEYGSQRKCPHDIYRELLPRAAAIGRIPCNPSQCGVMPTQVHTGNTGH